MQKHFKYSLIITVLTSTFAFAQQRTKDTLDTEVVTIVKPYTPTVSDAFKVKEIPNLNDSVTSAKKDVKYNIFSIPVASVFTPAKGKAAGVNKAKPVKLYDNYASLGVGSYTTILGEVYLNHEISRGETVGGYLSHHSSGGGINGLLLDDDFLNTKLNINYNQKLRDFSWTVDGGFLYQTYNWYGLPQPFFDETTASALDVRHSFFGANVGGKITFDDGIFKKGTVRFRHFGDNRGSGENRFTVKAVADVPIQDEVISTEVEIDYLGGSFDRNFYTGSELKYGNFNIGIAPSYQLTQDDLTVNLGAKLVYLNDIEAGGNKLYIYPNITATYRLVDELMIAFGGIQGGLIQNSYEDFAQENPFVSPTLFIIPTDRQYDAYVGVRGKLTNNLSYSVNGRYMAERAKALFMANSVLGGATEDYQYGNSFGIVYDNVKTIAFAGELSLDINRNFKLGAKAEYFSYNTGTQAEAWNLPDIKGSLFMDYQIDEQWFAGANLFFTGERKDRFYEEGTLLPVSPVTVTLDSFFDVNAHVGYKINTQFSVFAKVNNLFNQDYQRWSNFPVQGIQFLAGATYQFDF